MANLLLFPPQEFRLSDLHDQFPATGGFRNRKYFFQCEVRKINNSSEVIFGVIGYPAWRRGNSIRERWIIGKKVRGKTIRPADPGDPDETVWFDPENPDTYVALGNNEIFLGATTSGSTSKKSSKPLEEGQKDFIDLYKSIIKDEKKLMKATLSCKSHIFKNLHVYYDVTLSDGTSSATYLTNPCPPNQPSE